MECQICLEEFNSTERRPKVLPCGHTSCLRCLKKLPESKCPVDRKDFTGPPEKLVDNFQLLSSSSRPRPKFWCCDCKKTATSKECMEWHTVCSLNKVHLEEATSLLVRLSSAVNGVNAQMQAEEKLRELLAKQGLQSERLHKRLKKAQENLQQSVDKRCKLAEQLDEASTALAEAATTNVMGLVCGADMVSVTLTDTKADPYLLHLQDRLATYRLERTPRLCPSDTANPSPAASSASTTSIPPNNITFGTASSASTSPAVEPVFGTATTAPSSTIPSFGFFGSKSTNATTTSGTAGPPTSFFSPKSAKAATTLVTAIPPTSFFSPKSTTGATTSSSAIPLASFLSPKSATAATTSGTAAPAPSFGSTFPR